MIINEKMSWSFKTGQNNLKGGNMSPKKEISISKFDSIIAFISCNFTYVAFPFFS